MSASVTIDLNKKHDHGVADDNEYQAGNKHWDEGAAAFILLFGFRVSFALGCCWHVMFLIQVIIFARARVQAANVSRAWIALRF